MLMPQIERLEAGFRRGSFSSVRGRVGLGIMGPGRMGNSRVMAAGGGDKWEGECCPLQQLRNAGEAASITQGLKVIRV